jgi:hypothetical protein
MTLLLLIIAALATARITSLIVSDSILEGARHRLFLWSPPWDDEERGFAYQNVRPQYRQGKVWASIPRDPGFFGQLVSCSHCTAVWVAGFVYAAVHYDVPAILPILTVAALAQISEATIKASR